jgi:hypothetical protein
LNDWKWCQGQNPRPKTTIRSLNPQHSQRRRVQQNRSSKERLVTRLIQFPSDPTTVEHAKKSNDSGAKDETYTRKTTIHGCQPSAQRSLGPKQQGTSGDRLINFHRINWEYAKNRMTRRWRQD